MKIVRKVLEEIADSGIVAVAEDDFIPEVRFVVLKFALNIRIEGIELIAFVCLCAVKEAVVDFSGHFVVSWLNKSLPKTFKDVSAISSITVNISLPCHFLPSP